MTVHFIHVGKAGGTALRHAVRQAEKEGGPLATQWGPVSVQPGHHLYLPDIPDGDKAFMALRDPATRFTSGFYSRMRKGAPRHFREWSDKERQAFDWFETPEELADSLADTGEARERAEFAMHSIRHLRRPITLWTGNPRYFRRNLDKVLYVARQESLDEDWEKLKELLGIPRSVMLPHDDISAHRTQYPHETVIGERGRRALADWYAEDYEILEIAEDLRQGRRPPPPSGRERLLELGHKARKLVR